MAVKLDGVYTAVGKVPSKSSDGAQSIKVSGGNNPIPLVAGVKVSGEMASGLSVPGSKK